jgi:hypothetical protein
MASAEIRDILRSNKAVTVLGLSENYFGITAGAVGCIARRAERQLSYEDRPFVLCVGR